MVSAGDARLKIARELAPKTSEASKPRWGGKPVGAHAAIVPEAAQMVAAVPVAPRGPGHATVVVRWVIIGTLAHTPAETAQGPEDRGRVQEDVEEGGDEQTAMCVGRLGTWRPSALGGWSWW
jgi:hypothetical protein